MTKYARLLLGSYRTGEANDPEVYTAAVIAVLSDYPVDVVERVVDPRTGIPSKIKWLPTPSEIKDACEEIYAPIKYAREWDERAKAQLAEREHTEAARAARPNLDELKAKHGETYGLKAVPPRETEDTARDRRLRETAAYAQRSIVREYAALGIEPVMAGDMIVSPSLVKKIRAWQDDPETLAAEQRWKRDVQRRSEHDAA